MQNEPTHILCKQDAYIAQL